MTETAHPSPGPLDVVLSFCRAACSGDRDGAHRLLRRHPDTIRNSIHAAAVAGDVAAVAALLEQDSSRARRKLLNRWPPLLLLSMSVFGEQDGKGQGSIASCARLLLETGAEPMSAVEDGDMPTGKTAPLSCAAARGYDEVVKLLLEAGANAHDGDSLNLATAGGHWKVVDRLLAGGASFNDAPQPEGWLPLHWVLDRNFSRPVVEVALQRGADPDARVGPRQESALHVAVRRRRLEILDLLLGAGADIDATTRGGMTAYRHAVRRHFPEVAEFLAGRGARTELTPSDELARALRQGRIGKARALLEADPELAAPANPEEARLVADLASAGKIEPLRLLLDAGADIGAAGLDGGTPLHQAAWFGEPEVAELLIRRGADLHRRGDQHDSTPLGWAAHGSRYSGGAERRQPAYIHIVRCLLEAGAPLPGPDHQHDRPQLADASAGVQAVLRDYGWPPSDDRTAKESS